MNDSIRLTPVDDNQIYTWNLAKKYALVGNSSGEIHAIFTCLCVSKAMEIKQCFNETFDDSGYHLMVVEE